LWRCEHTCKGARPKSQNNNRGVIPGLPARSRFGKGRLDPESQIVWTQLDRYSIAAITDLLFGLTPETINRHERSPKEQYIRIIFTFAKLCVPA